jgi:hypothetical protein
MSDTTTSISSLIVELQEELWPWKFVDIKDFVTQTYIYFSGFVFDYNILKRARKIARKHNFRINYFEVNIMHGSLSHGRLLVAFAVVAAVPKEKRKKK